jgi:Sperm-tail PG-rich repeat
VIVGPGSYKIEDADQLTRFRIPSAKIPIAHNASQKTIQTMVGPGSYNELNVSSGPAYTI